jgi:hypothetical protein
MASDHWAAERNLCLQMSPLPVSDKCRRRQQIIQLYAGLKVKELSHVNFKYNQTMGFPQEFLKLPCVNSFALKQAHVCSANFGARPTTGRRAG